MIQFQAPSIHIVVLLPSIHSTPFLPGGCIHYSQLKDKKSINDHTGKSQKTVICLCPHSISHISYLNCMAIPSCKEDWDIVWLGAQEEKERVCWTASHFCLIYTFLSRRKAGGYICKLMVRKNFLSQKSGKKNWQTWLH